MLDPRSVVQRFPVRWAYERKTRKPLICGPFGSSQPITPHKRACVRRTTSPYPAHLIRGIAACARPRPTPGASSDSLHEAPDRSQCRRDCSPRLAHAKTTTRSASSVLFPLSSPNWTHSEDSHSPLTRGRCEIAAPAIMFSRPYCIKTLHVVSIAGYRRSSRRRETDTAESDRVPSGQGALKEPGGVVFREGSYTAGFRHGNRLRGRQP